MDPVAVTVARAGAAVRLRAIRTGAPRTGATPVLHDLDLTVAPGTVIAVVGANGSGKSTLLALVAGLLDPRSGTVRVDGMSPRAFRRRYGVGYLPDPPAAPAGWTVTELVRTLAPSRAPDATLLPPALVPLARRRVDRLSGGWKRRVLLTAILGAAPPLVLLDEPLSGADATARRDGRTALRRAASAGTTVILATHDPAAAAWSDRTLLLAHGTLREVSRTLGGGASSNGGPGPRSSGPAPEDRRGWSSSARRP